MRADKRSGRNQLAEVYCRYCSDTSTASLALSDQTRIGTQLSGFLRALLFDTLMHTVTNRVVQGEVSSSFQISFDFEELTFGYAE